MSALFKGIAKQGKLYFYNAIDAEKYFLEHDNIELIVSFKMASKSGPKMKLYAYYYGVILHYATKGLTDAGYDLMDNVKSDFILRSEFAKDFYKKPNGEYAVTILDKSTMSKERLLKYVQDCLFFLENTLGMIPPDAEEYKAFKNTGRTFKKVN